jgi:hypothetical protein
MSGKRIGVLTAVLAAGLVAALAFTATPASARPAAAAVPAAGSVSVAGDSATAGVDSAGDPCRTGWAQVTYRDVFGITLWWFRMTTSWCYNGSIVTSHTTTVSHDVTGTGTATGWAWGGRSAVSFNCYVASGSSRNCSGNHESDTAQFDYIPIPSVCVVKLQEWENYRGEFFWSSAGSTC